MDSCSLINEINLQKTQDKKRKKARERENIPEKKTTFLFPIPICNHHLSCSRFFSFFRVIIFFFFFFFFFFFSLFLLFL